VQADALTGICVATYALYVEIMLGKVPLYEPACNTSFGSCAKVFLSPQSHILSYWGIVPPGSPLDLSLATAGILLYSAYFVAISIPFRFLFREKLFLTTASVSVVFSFYLMWIVAYELNDFCVVCTCFHVLNFLMLILAIQEFRDPSLLSHSSTKKKTKAI